MRRLGLLLLVVAVMLITASPALADGKDKSGISAGSAATIDQGVRVVVVKAGGTYEVRAVRGEEAGARPGCTWTLVFRPTLDEARYGMSVGPMPDPAARFALVLCNGAMVRAIWVAPSDIVDLDAAARVEAQRYVEDVLTPVVAIGVNPAGKGLAGLRSWFWIDGFAGSVTAPAISAFGLTIDVRMSSGQVVWDFGDGQRVTGDLGRAYPQESTVRHAYRRAGVFAVTAVVELVPEYRVDGGPWLTLPDLAVTARTVHQVEERQPVITDV